MSSVQHWAIPEWANVYFRLWRWCEVILGCFVGNLNIIIHLNNNKYQSASILKKPLLNKLSMLTIKLTINMSFLLTHHANNTFHLPSFPDDYRFRTIISFGNKSTLLAMLPITYFTKGAFESTATVSYMSEWEATKADDFLRTILCWMILCQTV